MSKRRERPEPRERRSPDESVLNFSDEFIQGLNIPELPEGIPSRLEEGLRARITALLFHLREAKKENYVKLLEVRLVRDAFRAVLTAHELQLPDSEVLYAQFHHLVEELGYQRADVGFSKPDPE